jgi:hypothetical protein
LYEKSSVASNTNYKAPAAAMHQVAINHSASSKGYILEQCQRKLEYFSLVHYVYFARPTVFRTGKTTPRDYYACTCMHGPNSGIQPTLCSPFTQMPPSTNASSTGMLDDLAEGQGKEES